MQANQLTLQSSSQSLTSYDHAVDYKVRTPGQDYTVDKQTGDRLASMLLNIGDTKFIKLKTHTGDVVLNVSSIMGVTVDDKNAKTLTKTIEHQISQIVATKGVTRQEALEPTEEKQSYLYKTYAEQRKLASQEYVDRQTYDYFLGLAAN